jgi:hypothetical protein
MKRSKLILIYSISFYLILSACNPKKSAFAQITSQEDAWYKTISNIPTPEGYTRDNIDTTTFGYFLRHLPLKTSDNEVLLFNGLKKNNQSAQFAVVKMDIGTQDLQQCADAVMRLRGEYLFLKKSYGLLHFNFLSYGKPRYFKEYCNGDFSYKKFRSWMNYIFSFANTASLIKELKKVNIINDIEIGDVFIKQGNPYGHAVIVVDVAKNSKGEKIFLLAQSYMPAQEIHVLKNPENNDINPWYSTRIENTLITPEYFFSINDLCRFP